MASQDRYGAAVHEAGHVVVAWALGLKTRKLAVGIDGDDAAGAAEIEESSHLPTVDQIAICSAGADAQLPRGRQFVTLKDAANYRGFPGQAGSRGMAGRSKPCSWSSNSMARP
jgi:hypothetical protein